LVAKIIVFFTLVFFGAHSNDVAMALLA